MNLKTPRARALGALTLLGCGLAPAMAGTLYVEKWGDDHNTCGIRTNPCRTIQYAIEYRSGPRGKVVVGPGVYREILNINSNYDGDPLDGLRLESALGRGATRIESAHPDATLISIHRNHVRIGRKNRGFTLTGSNGSAGEAVMIRQSGLSGIRIEGNRVSGNRIGLILVGHDIQVRGNVVERNTAQGIYMQSVRKVLIQDNRIRHNGARGIRHVNAVGSSENVALIGNVIRGNVMAGYDIEDTTTGFRIRDNVISTNTGYGVRAEDSTDWQVDGNILALNGMDGLSFAEAGYGATGTRVNANVAVGNALTGFDLKDQARISMEANAAIQHAGFGFELGDVSHVEKFRRNNSYGNTGGQAGEGCGLLATGPVPFAYQDHFFGDPDGPDIADANEAADTACGAQVTGGTFASRPNRIRVNRAARL